MVRLWKAFEVFLLNLYILYEKKTNPPNFVRFLISDVFIYPLIARGTLCRRIWIAFKPPLFTLNIFYCFWFKPWLTERGVYEVGTNQPCMSKKSCPVFIQFNIEIYKTSWTFKPLKYLNYHQILAITFTFFLGGGLFLRTPPPPRKSFVKNDYTCINRGGGCKALVAGHYE